jgi:ArsR family transcriptional regulator
MAKQTAVGANCIDVMFKAFSDRTRLRILSLLQGGECCVGDLVEILRVEQPSASRHLAYLRRAGLVTVRKAGQWSYYSLAPARAAFHAKLLECLACCFQEVPQIQKDQARAQKVREQGGCCPTFPAAGSRKDEKVGECCSGR